MQSSQEIPTGLITHTLMTRLPTTCECKTFNLKMLNTTIYKIAIINAHSVFYSCQVYFFFKENCYTVVKTCIFNLWKAHILSQWCMVKHLNQVITSFIAKGPCTFINSSTLIATQQVINIQEHASWEASTITHPPSAHRQLVTPEPQRPQHWGLWTVTLPIHPEWKMEWLKYKCNIL